MKTRARLVNGLSASFTSTLAPPSSRTANLPVALIHCGGTAPVSKSHFQGSAGITRTRALPESSPTVALTVPAWAAEPAVVRRPVAFTAPLEARELPLGRLLLADRGGPARRRAAP